MESRNPNAPKKGSSIKVDPIRTLKDIKLIKHNLEDDPRNLCLFVLGINTNLRASDLLQITAGHVRHLKAGDGFTIKEKKTGKARIVTVNKAVVEAVAGLLDSREYNDADLLFTGQRGALTVPSVNRLVKRWCADINLRGNYGAHTLRKTFGVIQHEIFKVPLPELMTTFNHSSQKQTLDYLCIQSETIKNIFMNEI